MYYNLHCEMRTMNFIYLIFPCSSAAAMWYRREAVNGAVPGAI